MSIQESSKKLATYKDVALLYLKYGHNDELEKSNLASEFEIDQHVEPSEDAENFVADLEKLGPTFIKLGQLLSTRADLLPPQWLAALTKLQDDVEPFDFEQVNEIIESELGVRLSKLFDDFNETPIAAASLGQVHLATMRDSKRRVAVKVQRPGVRSKILREIEVIESVARFLESHTKAGKQLEPVRMVKQFRKSILSELNYQEEAANLTRLAANLSNHALLTIPKAYADYCSTKVLTMDYIDGTKITDISGVAMTELDGEKLAEGLFVGYLDQILLDGFFHGDPHPGNLLLTKDHRIALIDLGMTGTVSDQLKDHLLKLLSAISEGRSSDAADVTVKIGTKRDDYNDANLRESITEVVEKYQGLNVARIHIGQLVMEITQACGSNGLRIPNEMFMLGKMLLNLDGVGEILDKNFDPQESIRKHTSKIASNRMRKELTAGNVVPLLLELKEFVSKTPDRLNTFIENLSKNQVRIKVDTIDEQVFLKGLYQVANRITVGLIISALIIGAAMLMNIETSFKLFGYPGLAIIMFLIAAITGVYLVVRIFITDSKDN